MAGRDLVSRFLQRFLLLPPLTCFFSFSSAEDPPLKLTRKLP